jgi:hypothetical protein
MLHFSEGICIDGRIILKQFLKKCNVKCGMDSSGTATCSCEYDFEPSGGIKTLEVRSVAR